MAIAPDAKERWRRGLIGKVPIASARGMSATILLVLGGVVLFSGPIYGLFEWAVSGQPAATIELTREILWLNFAANAVLLLFIPLLAILITRPGEWGAPAVRLRLLVDKWTGLYALLGAGITFAALLALAAIVGALQYSGLYHFDESDIVDQLRPLLTPAVIVAVPILAAITEEVYFRGYLQPRIGIIGSSLLFGLVHSGYGTLLQLVAPFFLGLLFGYLFQRTRSLWAPIAGHFLFDFVQFIALYFRPQ